MFPDACNQSNAQGPFGCLAVRMKDVVVADGGIRKEVVYPGEGPTIPRGASVSLHYSAFLEYAEQPYETTSHRKYPRMMKLGKDITLAGLELGLMTMKKGESSRFLLQPQYAYGEMGCFPLIPPASTILFEVQVFDFLDMAQAHHFFTLEPDERNAFPLSVLASVADTLRYYANYCFRQGHFDNAKWRYKKLMAVLTNRLTGKEKKEGLEEEEKEEKVVKALLLPVYLNLCLTELRLESPQKALQYANRALAIDPQSTKALFRCGQAYMDLHEYEQAQRVLIMAQAKKPDDCQINGLLLKVAICHANDLEQQKELYSRMFQSSRT